MEEIRFYYNGIKGSDAKLQKCSYSLTPLRNYPENTITIYAKERTIFSEEIRKYFEVKNDTDSTVDYYDNDTIRVEPSHKMYQSVREAANKSILKRGY